ncbi:zinc finger C3H1 domain-containing protein isoform X1 [Paramormyrops kingsleyae]|uniref:zinc finger C3H1 domain-containing protein isoform X1 n=1 Tax=Paramormyrops kingsleyae TaxID=1676925 RepID=UPI003B97ABCD
METSASGGSPKEEGELEDGEICDDDADEKQLLRRDTRPSVGVLSSVGSARCNRKSKAQTRAIPAAMGAPGADFRAKGPFNRGSHPHPSFLPPHRLLGGPSGPDRPLPGQHGDPCPRSSFWERSHTALGRLRYRGKPNQPRGDWNRGAWGDGGGGRENARPPPGRFEFGENYNNRKESPLRKQKVFGRTQARKPAYNVAKAENGVDESFEDLLMKYKQIQLELECIRNEEKMALKPKEESSSKEEQAAVSVNVVPGSKEDSIKTEAAAATEESVCPERVKKVFQAFNLRPLRQKLPTPAERDKMNKKTTKEPEKAGLEGASPTEPSETKDKEEDEEKEEADIILSNISSVSDKDRAGVPVKPRDEDDELSELQLRLLALQSASKKWQQKEQQVMKESKEKIIKAKPAQERGKAAAKAHQGKKNVSPGSAAKQAWRKQQLRTWKLQHQKEQQEEEERRKREDEIRKIRDLSNQDEQYNRFMKLVGGQRRPRGKSLDPEHRKSLGKQGLDISGNLYQYDNYDEVAMETDSETSSPAASPTREPFLGEGPPFLHQIPAFPVDSPPHSTALQDVDHRYLDPFALASMAPPPPLPPLPPDEPEQPPKPPFADEEEEEEMMLREELLKSLANKRAVKSEETSSNSDPPSPLVGPVFHTAPKSGLAESQSRGQSVKFTRGHSRRLLVLPRHKAVVVQLNASDDSDSEGETPSAAPDSTRIVFGGLESMIKEARRTAEAAKPKMTSGSEKENNPMRTPDALPEAKKMEYRQLKEEIASREKQRVLKLDPSRGVSSPASVNPEPDPKAWAVAAAFQVTEAQNRVTKHKNLLLKDEALLKHLLQQELKKKEFLKVAEAKVAKLKEQLLASEKIVSANTVLLKKLQEQIHRVQHRVSVKKHLAQKLERDLVQARAAAGRLGAKRKSDMSFLSPSKLFCLDGPARSSEQQFAELIAQKQRLQQLESEYALKIKMLKDAQALRNREVQAELSPALAPPQSPPPSAYPLPQPSLHDLTQDKLVLTNEEPEAEDEMTSPCPPGGRRRSFRESGSFTKPKLQATPVKATPSKTTDPSKKGLAQPELFLGLDVGDLQKRYRQSTCLAELMEMGPSLAAGSLGTPTSRKQFPADLDLAVQQAGRPELKPAPFGPYHSPLLAFKSYRFSPYFRTKEKLSLSSLSYSNAIEPRKCFCRFDLTGTCNDDSCPWQHMRDCSLKGNQLFQDILSYSLPLIGCSENTTNEEISIATEKYISKLFGPNKDRMGMDQKAVLLVSKVNESRGHVPPFTTYKDGRKWRPQPRSVPVVESGRDSTDEEAGPVKYESSSEACWTGVSVMDACITQDDDRYFTGETDDISNLETSVLESPKDVQLWIKLAYKYLTQKESSASECLDAALNTLSRALEDNRHHPEVWCHYLTLFSRRARREEVQEMCEMAVEYAPDYQVWWKYLNIESSFDCKDYVCGRMLQYLWEAAEGTTSERLSFQLLESLLYRVQLSLFCGRRQNAQAILQDALKPPGKALSLAQRLSPADRSLAWLCYIHLSEFGSLPASLFDPAEASPSRVVCKEAPVLPWRSAQDLSLAPDVLVALFEDAVCHCTDESLSPSDRVLACLPLYTNLIALNQLLGKLESAVALCESLLESCPQCCPLLEALAGLHLKSSHGDQAVSAWLSTWSRNPHNAEIFYRACSFLISQEKSSATAPLFEEFVVSICEDTAGERLPVNVLCYILGIPVQDTLRAPRIKSHLQDQLVNQTPYLYLIYCLWQSMHGGVGEAVDAFERALGTVMQEDAVQQLWLDYLLFTSSKFLGPQCKSTDLKIFRDLVHRCLATVPTRTTVPFSSTHYWSNYRFHNKVISFYLDCLPQSQHSYVLENLRYLMPSNTDLVLRFLQREWQDGNIQHLKVQTRMLCSSLPSCLATWKIAIAVQTELRGQVEVRRLFRQALQKLPLCAALWKDRLLYEAAEGGKTDKLRKVIDACQEVGVSLDEVLNSGSERTQEKEHRTTGTV